MEVIIDEICWWNDHDEIQVYENQFYPLIYHFWNYFCYKNGDDCLVFHLHYILQFKLLRHLQNFHKGYRHCYEGDNKITAIIELIVIAAIIAIAINTTASDTFVIVAIVAVEEESLM